MSARLVELDVFALVGTFMTVVTPGNASLLIIGGLIVYLFPSIVALVRRRRVSSVGWVVIINVLLGWTLVGWVVALIMAFRVSQPIDAR
jgi:hypothetical protein